MGLSKSMNNMNTAVTALSTQQMAKLAHEEAEAQKARDDVQVQLLNEQRETNRLLQSHHQRVVFELQAQNRMLWDLLQRGRD